MEGTTNIRIRVPHLWVGLASAEVDRLGKLQRSNIEARSFGDPDKEDLDTDLHGENDGHLACSSSLERVAEAEGR